MAILNSIRNRLFSQPKSESILYPADFIRDVRGRFQSLIFMLCANVLFAGYSLSDPTMTTLIPLAAGASVGLLMAVLLLAPLRWKLALESANFLDDFARGTSEELTLRRSVQKQQITQGSVYVLQDVDVTFWCKIGKSISPAQRLGKFDVMLPFETRLIHVIESKDCTAVETMLHRHFAAKRKRGEWFALDEADIAWLKQLSKV